jgi:hypothetical protein
MWVILLTFRRYILPPSSGSKCVRCWVSVHVQYCLENLYGKGGRNKVGNGSSSGPVDRQSFTDSPEALMKTTHTKKKPSVGISGVLVEMQIKDLWITSLAEHDRYINLLRGSFCYLFQFASIEKVTFKLVHRTVTNVIAVLLDTIQ